MSRRLLSQPSTVRAVLRDISAHSRLCPCHSCVTKSRRVTGAAAVRSAEYAFQMETSTLRFGRGIVNEVGHDLEALGARRVGVVTDPRLAATAGFERAISALESRKVKYAVYNQARCEPTDASMRDAAEWARGADCDAFLAIGGGSSIDTAKVANLMSCHPHNEIDDFVNAPIGKGMPIPNTLHPLVALVTTAGTGSEATGNVH